MHCFRWCVSENEISHTGRDHAATTPPLSSITPIVVPTLRPAVDSPSLLGMGFSFSPIFANQSPLFPATTSAVASTSSAGLVADRAIQTPPTASKRQVPNNNVAVADANNDNNRRKVSIFHDIEALAGHKRSRHDDDDDDDTAANNVDKDDDRRRRRCDDNDDDEPKCKRPALDLSINSSSSRDSSRDRCHSVTSSSRNGDRMTSVYGLPPSTVGYSRVYRHQYSPLTIMPTTTHTATAAPLAAAAATMAVPSPALQQHQALALPPLPVFHPAPPSLTPLPPPPMFGPLHSSPYLFRPQATATAMPGLHGRLFHHHHHHHSPIAAAAAAAATATATSTPRFASHSSHSSAHRQQQQHQQHQQSSSFSSLSSMSSLSSSPAVPSPLGANFSSSLSSSGSASQDSMPSPLGVSNGGFCNVGF